MNDASQAPPPHYIDAAAQLWPALEGARTIVTPFHINADPDAVGSALGAYQILRAAGKEVTVVASDGAFPKTTTFLPGAETIVPYRCGEALPDADLILALDASDPARLGELYTDNRERFQAGPVVMIDHHVTHTLFGTGGHSFVDTSAAATAEIVYLLARGWNLAVPRDAATSLLAGIYGDTLALQTSSTTPRTLRVVADLLALGADLTSVVNQFYRQRPYETVRLWGEVLSGATWCGETLWSEVTPEVLERSGADASQTGGVIGFLTGTVGARVTVLLYRGDNEWRAGLRTLTDEVDVAAIAATFGGGGHRKAAGCRIAGGVAERDAFLRAVDYLAAAQARGERAGPPLPTT